MMTPTPKNKLFPGLCTQIETTSPQFRADPGRYGELKHNVYRDHYTYLAAIGWFYPHVARTGHKTQLKRAANDVSFRMKYNSAP